MRAWDLHGISFAILKALGSGCESELVARTVRDVDIVAPSFTSAPAEALRSRLCPDTSAAQ